MAYRAHLRVAVLMSVAACGGEVVGISPSGIDGATTFDAATGVIHPDGGRDGGVIIRSADGGTVIVGADGGIIVIQDDSGVISPPPPPTDSGIIVVGPADGGIVVTNPGDSGIISFPPPPSSDGGVVIITPGKDGGVSVPVDAGGPASTTIPCGASSCDINTQECCVSVGGSSCVAEGSCQGASLSCTGSSNCSNGEVCCAVISFAGGTATCQASCGGGGVGGGLQLCNSNADCSNGETCKTTPLGVSICRGGGGGGGGGGGAPGH